MFRPSLLLCFVVAVGAISFRHTDELKPGKHLSVVEKNSVKGEDWVSAARKAASANKVHLKQADFAKGTFRIKAAGEYILDEDIIFEPPSDDYYVPDADSKEYPIANYFMGFFAAITVEAENVVINLNGKSITQSFVHLLYQRFYAHIELCDRPFQAGGGPPHFGALKTDLTCGKNVIIENGRLGSSSHHGIHGNANENVLIQGLTINDFEVGGIGMNGPKHLTIKDCTVGPSKTNVPALATLSQANFLIHYVSEVIPGDATTAKKMNEELTLRGEKTTAKTAFKKLEAARETFVASMVGGKGCPKSDTIFCNPSGLPDGSAIYGIVLHKQSPAVSAFGGCSAEEEEKFGNGETEFEDITISGVDIQGIALDADEIIITMNQAGVQNMGPAGDVFQSFNHASVSIDDMVTQFPKGDISYVGHELADAQLALGVVAAATGYKDAERFAMFGKTNISPEVLEYAAGSRSLQSLFEGDAPMSVKCNADSMHHISKGAVGLRLEFVKNVKVSDVTITEVTNKAPMGMFTFCQTLPAAKAEHYHGADSRAASTRFVHGATYTNVKVDDIRSVNGFAGGWDLGTDSEAKVANLSVVDVDEGAAPTEPMATQ